MAELPILIFPKAKEVQPEGEKGFPPSFYHFPPITRQIERLSPQIEAIQTQFQNAELSASTLGIEPEMVLVIEIIGSITDFSSAIAQTEGLEWLAEWDLGDIPANDDFYDHRQENKKQVRSDKFLSGQLFLSMSNYQGKEQLLSLWEKWQQGKKLQRGQTKWRDVFQQMKTLRLWGIKDQFINSGMLDYWKENLADNNIFQIEFFYRSNEQLRRTKQEALQELIQPLQGNIIGSFIDTPEIRFHAVKVEMPKEGVESLVDQVEVENTDSRGFFGKFRIFC